MVIALRLLGGFRAVRDDGQVVQMPDRSRALLAHLAVAASPIQRAALATLLSPDEREQDQRKNLRQALYVIRRELAHDAIICTEHGDLVLNGDVVHADVRQFRRAISAGDEHSIAEAIALYRGAFLEGEACPSADFEDWLRARRGELLEEVIRALLQVARRDMDCGIYDGALSRARRALELDSLCEEAHRQVIRCFAALGERSNALRHYETVRQTFADELGVELDAETAELRRTLAEGSAEGLTGSHDIADSSGTGFPLKNQPESAIANRPERKPAKATPVAIGFAMIGAAAIVSIIMILRPESRLPVPQTLPSIAVLPFENASGDRAEAYIGYGIAEELTAMLASHPGLSVLSPCRAKSFGPDAGPGDVSKQSGFATC